jgi:DNA-binding transcriptional ArsR family regulator
MQDVIYIDDVAQATVLMKPARLDVLRRMATETTCNELAAALGSSPQKVYYHVKALEQAGLVERVSERKVRGIHEGIYRAKARAYWLSPRLVGHLGGERASRDHASLGYLISLAEEVQEDVGRLAERAGGDEDVPSLGVSARIELKDAADRAAFMKDVQRTFESLARKYGATGGAKGPAYKLALACYPAASRGGKG